MCFLLPPPSSTLLLSFEFGSFFVPFSVMTLGLRGAWVHPPAAHSSGPDCRGACLSPQLSR